MPMVLAARIRQNILPVLLCLLGIMVMALVFTPMAVAADYTGEQQSSSQLTAKEYKMVELINQARQKAGATDLKVDAMLSTLAKLKANDLVARGYLVNNSPTYGTMEQMLQQAKVPYLKVQETIFKASDALVAHDILLGNASYQKSVITATGQLLGAAIVTDNKGYDYVVLVLVQQKDGASNNPVLEPGSGGDKHNTKPVVKPEPKPQPKPVPKPTPTDTVTSLTPDEAAMLTLVNEERMANGVAPLKINQQLVSVARVKAQDMIQQKYFDHTSPTYGSPFDMLKQFKIGYSYAGENLAGASQVKQAHVSLMNSPGHKRNILNGNYTEVGIGVVNGGPYGKMFVQLFIRP